MNGKDVFMPFTRVSPLTDEKDQWKGDVDIDPSPGQLMKARNERASFPC
jgi:hypothetical protein